MPQFLALEWDTTEARIALASGRGEQAVIEQAFAVELRPRQLDGDRAEVDVGARLAAALAARGIGKVDALVAIGRSNIELRQLVLPPAPDVELPEIVRFQAMREFNELDDDWRLDFIPLTDAPEESRTVLAAAIGPEWIEQIQKVCTAMGVRPRRLVLRACAAAAHLTRMQPGRDDELRLLVDLLSDEADLTVVSGDRVVFMRTTRIGGDAAGVSVLLSEIRRTMVAVQNQLGGRKVDAVVICGLEQQQAELALRIEAELEVSTDGFAPFAGLHWGRSLQEGLPDHPGRFAPLLGMLLTELEQRRHAVDFLHPRRRPLPPRKGKWYVLAAAAAVLLLVLPLFGYKVQRSRLNEEVNQLGDKSKNLDPEVKKAQKDIAHAAAIEKWTAADVVWLDALYTLSREFPPAEKAMLKELDFKSRDADPPGGEIHLRGLIRSNEELNRMEEQFRRSHGQVKVGKSNADDSIPPYRLHFDELLILQHPESPPKKTERKETEQRGQRSESRNRPPAPNP
ncbi:MAG: hypothetical protein JXB10_13195 [Pirellulales bacterium]|nr:hypothetical protein [Pirellulales bacterium]